MKHIFRCLLLSTVVLGSSAVFAAGVYDGERNAFNRFHGQGTYKYANGNVYTGEWKDGRKSGNGVQIWTNGNRYEGEWSENRQNGQGTMTWANKDEYTGQWAGGKRHGTGTMTWADGSSYQGYWQADRQSGQGTLTSKDGTVIAGAWKEGKVVGDAIVSFANGIRYTGPVKANRPHGKGVCKKADRLFPCEYKAGILKTAKKAKYKPKTKPAPRSAPKPKVIAKTAPKPKPVPKPKSTPKPVVKLAAVPQTRTAPVTRSVKPAASLKNSMPSGFRHASLTAKAAAGSRFSFQHNWTGTESSNLSKAWVKHDVNQVGDLKITAEGDFVVVLMIDEYFGPGEYQLKYFKGSVSRPGVASYQTTSSQPGKVVITEDTDKVMKGTFQFTGYRNGNRASGESRVVQAGEFVLLKGGR
ncbi:MAG: hypothetical protein CSA49_07155 [Gammaproteobacteria bacterium]|nr:MAG: hypothetical protein CSA49_07155 [Gammaproteobacteria bacterium]